MRTPGPRSETPPLGEWSLPLRRVVTPARSAMMGGMQWWQVRRALNLANGSTVLGLGIAALGRARVAPGPRGLLLATGYRIGFPIANAFTVGNVVITAAPRAWLESSPRTLRHEERHAGQYACLGVPMIGLYVVAMGWSYLRCRNPFLHNAFERLAGLEDGGYL